MAAVKRPYDVISINSDSSEDDLDRFARPPKLARHNNMYSGPDYYQDDYFGQDNMEGLMRTGLIVKDEHAGIPQAEAGATAATPETIESGDEDIDAPLQFGYEDIQDLYHVDIDDFPNEAIVITDTPPTPERGLLDRVLDIVPDVAQDHVTQLLETHQDDIEQVIEVLFAAPYPKERDKRAAEEAAKQTALREQKAAEEAEQNSLLNPQCTFSGKMKDTIIEVLKDEFNTIPVKYIRKIQKTKTHLYATYLALNEAKHADVRPFGKTPRRPLKDVDFDLLATTKDHKANVPILKAQFESAKKAAAEWDLQLRKNLAQKKKAEEEAAAKTLDEVANLEQAKASGAVVECAACFDEFPSNRVVKCASTDAHSVCLECMKIYLESEVGQSSFKLACPGGCDDTFHEPQLRLVPDADALVDELMHLRQEDDLRTAGIDDVEACPFCDFKTVCLPIEIDFEFHCQSFDCGITSCRKCKEETHIPDSCEENQRKRSKDAALTHRHKIEEARSKALIRNCNKCKRSFIKSEGCNKMTCPTCGNLQCYLCGKDVTANYAHFQPPNPCPTFDVNMTVEGRHEQEVNAAAEAAQAEVLRDHPELDKNYLDINFSDNVKEVERPPTLPRPIPDVNQLIHQGEMAQHRRRPFVRAPLFGVRQRPGAGRVPGPLFAGLRRPGMGDQAAAPAGLAANVRPGRGIALDPVNPFIDDFQQRDPFLYANDRNNMAAHGFGFAMPFDRNRQAHANNFLNNDPLFYEPMLYGAPAAMPVAQNQPVWNHNDEEILQQLNQAFAPPLMHNEPVVRLPVNAAPPARVPGGFLNEPNAPFDYNFDPVVPQQDFGYGYAW
ncbi:hypothetical protein AUEXF2481DRAFT_215998 [Aureobasidium subglaciale EXF-2481]|uniref:RING-type domain-containing protein n=1 Tax=Aureobasidium subglaciale (strain EXF-2481) TaxID=1043005 RepID=A0A074YBZ8_AURSE|nr:uncharacterized protein AUEXF2481DRAFT_215998 [Aureobasidium subglaciale EXF-2481]KAI5193988.1 hypothetical protein E4T38_09776 [Aureobasidium subglaciale]KAI5213419.1 hypothetical protein E4T40_09748 [Aureobasidium subglaciale]KAI5214911.1 hypothetical protein E4T41_09777 [Aureobasidium subglaciale]KAI5252993.1 hypothetical protein E4T46_09753 [Aureobasidium subglaciale]KEQ95323.1 hypothetical protein AUEXF2481DRAFT_215998 [Aureobasidium subglaciale EXF-2481]